MNPLFALALDGRDVAIAVMAVLLVVGLGVAMVNLFFREDTKLIAARRALADFARVLIANDMGHVAQIVQDLSLGDFPSAVGHAKHLAELLKDPKQAAALFDSLFTGQLAKRLADPNLRVPLLKALGDFAVANPDAVKAVGLAIALLPK